MGVNTNGGRKNCSNTTYMPRSISVKRKYLPALSQVFSWSSNRFAVGNLKPDGGGPLGVASRIALVERYAVAAKGLLELARSV
jgi:hypothetical protein